MDALFLPHEALQLLVTRLKDQGFACVGPQTSNGAVQFDYFEQLDQLTRGLVDNQQPGSYRIEKTDTNRIFEVTNSTQGLKPWVFKPRETLWYSQHDANGHISFAEGATKPERVAYFGARACDIAALAIQDAHFLQNDAQYRQRRENLFIIGVNCHRSVDTCFCVSAGDGPEIRGGADIVLSELDDGFIIHETSLRARLIIDELKLSKATKAHIEQCNAQLRQAEQQQRKIPKNLKSQLREKANSPVWAKVSETCLACGNCTSVCPTCFCNNQRDVPSDDTSSSEHIREWDSCFTQQHSYIHGITIRAQTQHRYRQWLTHKLDTWHDQFGQSGCVGCGRCITWCPVGIDITELVNEVVGDSA